MKKQQNTQQELRLLARFCSLRRTRVLLFAGFLFHILYSLFAHYTSGAIYPTVLLIALPPALTAIFEGGKEHFSTKGNSQPPILECLLNHYHFRKSRFFGELFSYAFQIFILMLWQKRSSTHPVGIAWYDNYPLLLVVGSFVIMILLDIFYRIYLPHRLLRHDYH